MTFNDSSSVGWGEQIEHYEVWKSWNGQRKDAIRRVEGLREAE